MHSFQSRIGNRISKRRGFSLIELLVVIAIIAILAAIIFPVFSAVRENAREATTMSNLHNIQAALALYKLDNRRYPDVLFAYACDGSIDPVTGAACSANDTMATVKNDPNNHSLLVGLYPEYDKNWQDFTCPNNLITDQSAVAAGVQDNTLCPKSDAKGTALPVCAGTTLGQIVPSAHSYFKADALDISPMVSNVNQFNGGNTQTANWIYLPRYQTSWLSYPNANASSTNNPTDPDYIRQLRWQNPPGNTYVTSVTYHVPNADKLLVLYEGGFVKKAQMPAGWFPPNFTNNTPAGWEQGYIDGSNTIQVPSAGGNSQAEFWRYDGTH